MSTQISKQNCGTLRTKVFDIDQKSHLVLDLSNNVSTSMRPREENNEEKSDIHTIETTDEGKKLLNPSLINDYNTYETE